MLWDMPTIYKGFGEDLESVIGTDIKAAIPKSSILLRQIRYPDKGLKPCNIWI